jgi:hypothetical protein
VTLWYRDVAAAGIPPSGPTALPDPDGFKTVNYRNKTATSTPPPEIAAVNKVKPHFIVSNEVLLKAPSVSRNAPRSISLCSVAFSMRVTTLGNAVSVDFTVW